MEIVKLSQKDLQTTYQLLFWNSWSMPTQAKVS
jgi:hypothetical protein